MIKQNSEQVVVPPARCQTPEGCLVFHINKNKHFLDDTSSLCFQIYFSTYKIG